MKTQVEWIARTVAQTLIELRNVSVSFGAYGARPLLRNVNLRVERDEAFALIGPSGHGKSVLLKIIAGLINPVAGEVLIEGQNLVTMGGKARDALVTRMGMLFQKNALFDSLTVAENIAFPLRETRKNTSEAEVQDAIAYYLEAVGLIHAKDLFPDEISGGMQKRLGIARALALKPEIILYDDPTAGLDPITSRKIIDLILRLKSEYRSTIVMITNDMNRAYQLHGRIGMVVDGEVLTTGTADETRHHPDKRVQQFIQGALQGPLTVTA